MSQLQKNDRQGSALYCIVQTENGWSIQLNRKEMVSCSTLELAIRAAVHSAFRAYRLGHRARVIMHDGRSLRTLWANGRLPSEPLHRLAVSKQHQRRSHARRSWRRLWDLRRWTVLGEPQIA